MRTAFLCFCWSLLLLGVPAWAQHTIKGRVFDAKTRNTIPFATIKYGSGGQGVIAALDGSFELQVTSSIRSGSSIEVSCMGYKTKDLTLPLREYEIYLDPTGSELGEVTIKPPYEKIRHILNSAIANKYRNNPDKYDFYRCHIYYKMKVDMVLPDSVMHDTAKSTRQVASFMEHQHLLLSETYSIRTWQHPQRLQDEVLATRLSGLKKSVFTSMITDVLPFHAYTDFIALNGKDYHNPVSAGYEQHYRFNLSDEIMDGTDTIWVLSFRPKGTSGNSLTGKVYIHSGGYAISQLIAKARDTIMKQTVRIEQQYGRLPYDSGGVRWFPKQLNYVIDREMKSDKTSYTIHMTGNSQIDSVTWTGADDFRFDRRHTVKIDEAATEHSDSLLNVLRPDTLNKKEQNTYRVIDSLGKKVKADKIMEHMRNLPQGRIAVGPIDLDIARLLSYNKYENIRLGLGGQTNDRLIRWLSVGGWGGYGFGDKRWKYGGFAEIYLDKYKEFVIRGGYTDDIADPGRIRMAPELDKTGLRMLLLQRVDQAKTYTVSVRKKLGYWSTEIAALQQEIIPRYDYALRVDGTDHATFEAKEASLNLRYAYAERTAPFFGTYYKISSKYPVWYSKVTAGNLASGTMQNNYVQAITAVMWQKHVNRLGTEKFMIEAGKSWSDKALPLSKLFAGNGFKYDSKSALSLYAFGGLMTMFPYDYYSDQFVQVICRHDFDWKLYKLESPKSKYSSAPNIALQYDLLYGQLDNIAAHQNIVIGVPDAGYHEAGILINNLLRQRSNAYYQSLNIGYFYHITPDFDPGKNGKVVIGLSIEL